MAKRRPDDFDLASVMAKRDFTPAASDVPSLLAMATGEDEARARDATLALVRVPDLALDALARTELDERTRARSARMLTRFPRERALPALRAQLDDASSLVRRAAAQALARIGPEGAEDALLARFPAEDAAETRALATALGRTSSEAARAALRAFDPGDDDALTQIVERARLTLTRSAARAETVSLDASVRTSYALRVALVCRAGLESLLASSLTPLRGVSDVRVGRGRVTASLDASPSVLFGSRFFHTMELPLGVMVDPRDAEEGIADALASPYARTILSTFTVGTPRIRVAFDDGKKRRASIWRIAAALDARGLLNDPARAPWHALVRKRDDGMLRVVLVPRGIEDPRFAYRVADVPASTHPTIAAAMASLCPLGADEVVWDPFAGAGVELVERARLGPFARLYGTDTDERALHAARANLASAEVTAELFHADATTFRPKHAPTTILTNPPMGLRVHRGGAREVLATFLDHLAETAAARATLVWLNPAPNETGPLLDRAGFRLDRAFRVDMGGFDVSLERRVRGA